MQKKRDKRAINRDKRFFYLLLAILAIAILGLLANAVVDTTKSWHPLQQVAKSDTDITSVDENNNKIIDEAETLSLVGGVATIGNPASSTALAIKGVGTGWSAIDFYSGNTNLWGMGRDSSGYFYIDRTGVGRALTIDASRNVGIGTTNPGTSKLSVYDASGITTIDAHSNSASGYARVLAQNSESINNLAMYSYGTAGTGLWGGTTHFSSVPVGDSIALLGSSGTPNLVIGNPGGKIHFGAGGGVYYDTAPLAMTISGANVGIGTTTPDHKLQIVSGDANLLRLKNTAGGDFRILSPASGEFGIYDEANSAYRIYTKGANVGIGTINPVTNFHVKGYQNIESTDGTKDCQIFVVSDGVCGGGATSLWSSGGATLCAWCGTA